MGLGIMGRNLPPLRAAGEGTTSGACLYAPGPVTGLGRPYWGRVGEGRRGRAVRGNGLEDRGAGRAGRPTAPSPQNSARVPLRESDSERPQRLPLGNPRVYGQESCPQPENDHREDEKNSPYKPEGSFGESHKTCRCRPSPSSRTQDATRNCKSARRKMIYDVLREGTAC